MLYTGVLTKTTMKNEQYNTTLSQKDIIPHPKTFNRMLASLKDFRPFKKVEKLSFRIE